MSAEPGSITRHADYFVPIAQNIERARPKRHIAGESPAGDTNSRVWFNSQNAALPRLRRRCDSVHPLHFCPCGVVQSTRLPLMQEITGAKPVRDAKFHFALKALSAMRSLGKRFSSVQLRVRAPTKVVVRKHRSRASAQVGFISPLCPGLHRRLRPFCLHAAACRFLL